LKRQVVELHRSEIRDASWLGEAFEVDPGIIEECDGVLRTEFEEVVAELRRADGGHQGRTSHTVLEADGRVHVVGHERQVVDAPPTRASER
jgi:hypothetical protein